VAADLSACTAAASGPVGPHPPATSSPSGPWRRGRRSGWTRGARRATTSPDSGAAPGPTGPSASCWASQSDNRARCQPRWPWARIDRGTGRGHAPMTHSDTAHALVLHDDATASDGSRTVSRRKPPRVTSGAKPRPVATTRRCAEAVGQGPGRAPPHRAAAGHGPDAGHGRGPRRRDSPRAAAHHPWRRQPVGGDRDVLAGRPSGHDGRPRRRRPTDTRSRSDPVAGDVLARGTTCPPVAYGSVMTGMRRQELLEHCRSDTPGG